MSLVPNISIRLLLLLLVLGLPTLMRLKAPAAEQTNSAPKLDLTARDALLEIVQMPDKSHMGKMCKHDEILKWPVRAEMVKRLVFFLKHRDERVRQAAFTVLLAIQPDRPGDMNDAQAWETWLRELEKSQPAEGPQWITEGWPSTIDLYADIIHIRTHVRTNTKLNLVRDPASHDALKRLVHYLRHPERRVRHEAYRTLTSLQGDCPAGKPEIWERWLRDLEAAARDTSSP